MASYYSEFAQCANYRDTGSFYCHVLSKNFANAAALEAAS